MMTKIIDCTIREGGHLRGWNFDDSCVVDSYNASLSAGVDYFEIGYRCSSPKKEWGKYARCEDDFISDLLKVDDRCKLSIMIDAGKCSADEFKKCSPISLVRISAYPDKLDIGMKLCEDIKEKGYSVILNLMALSEYKDQDFNKIANWENKNILDSICFADSFGSFLPEDINYFGKKLKEIGFENVSLHAHNNLQLAFANSLEGINNNFYSIDASIYGMGRGAGILPLELIIGHLNKSGLKKYNPTNLLEVLKKYYLKFKNETPWGYGIAPLVGGLKGIHPYYARELVDMNLDIKKVYEIADELKKSESVSYDINNIENILSHKN